MAFLKDVLRPRKEKPKKPPPKSNAQKLREYKARVKADPVLYAEWKEKKKQENERRRASLTDEQKLLEREKGRLRQQACRAKKKAAESKSNKKKEPKSASSQCMTRVQAVKAAEKRETNRLRQQKRRQLMSAQKRRRLNEKRRERYHSKRKQQAEASSKPKAKLRLDTLLRGVQNSIKKSRTKLSLFKIRFLKKILARRTHGQNTENHQLHVDSFYRRAPRNDFVVEHFLDKVSIDFPGLRGSSSQKKVLTKTMTELLKDFKTEHPNVKMSLTTFKRRRPRNIILSSSRKFTQCLCEKCTNIMLLVNVLNPFLKKRNEGDGDTDRIGTRLTEKISCVEDLVSRTLCADSTKDCWERKCSNCGVGSLIRDINRSVGRNGTDIKKWSRWERTEKSPKDLVFRENSISDILNMLKIGLGCLAKHVKTAEWQRKIYQEMKANIPKFHAMCTLDFAENYLCKYQNEVQSAHWSYKQVTVHPCVFFYKCHEPECSKLITEYIIFLSDDLVHDCYFTKYIIDFSIAHAKSKGMAAIHLFSDGCGSQYKSRFTFHHLTELQEKHNNITISRHYFGANHGKSLCDSSGGVVKNSVSRAVASGSHIVQGAAQMYNYCAQNMTVTDSKIGSHCAHGEFIRSFVLVNTSQLDRLSDKPKLKPVKGTQNIHFLKPLRKGMMKVKGLSCTCDVCLLGERGRCTSEDFSLKWEQVRLTHTKSRNSRTQCQEILQNNVSDEPIDTQSQMPLSLSQTVISKSPACNADLAIPMSRKDFFDMVQERMSECMSFDDLKTVLHFLYPLFNDYVLPTISFKCVIDVGIVDRIALNLLPSGLISKLYPVLTTADGNCVPRALSLLIFGDQDHHIEIRCRIIAELVSNSLDYLCLDKNEINFLCQISDVIGGSPEEVFKQEVLNVCQKSSFMGLWQLMGASNAIGVSIISVYPLLGPKPIRSFFNRTIKPRLETSPVKFMLMWSSTEFHNSEMPEEYWTANHVVPLLHLNEPVEIVVDE